MRLVQQDEAWSFVVPEGASVFQVSKIVGDRISYALDMMEPFREYMTQLKGVPFPR